MPRPRFRIDAVVPEYGSRDQIIGVRYVLHDVAYTERFAGYRANQLAHELEGSDIEVRITDLQVPEWKAVDYAIGPPTDDLPF